MADVTVVEKMEGPPFNIEVVKITVSDGETFYSKRFSHIIGALATLNFADGEFTDETISVDDANFSNGYVTIELLGSNTTDVPATLVLFGTP